MNWITCVEKAITENPESDTLDVLLPKGTSTNGLMIGGTIYEVRGRHWIVFDFIATSGEGIRLFVREHKVVSS